MVHNGTGLDQNMWFLGRLEGQGETAGKCGVVARLESRGSVDLRE